MKFPNIEEIATRDVAAVSEGMLLRDALDAMMNHNIRDIVVTTDLDGEYGILTVNDIIRARVQYSAMDMSVKALGYRKLPKVVVGTNILHILGQRFAEDSYLIVTGETGELFGIVSETDIITHIDSKMVVEQQCIGDIIGRHKVKTLPASSPLAEVLSLLDEVDDAVVLTEQGQARGIITTKDAVRLIHADVPLSAAAGEHMTSPLQTVGEHISVRDALDHIHQTHFKRIVVADNNGGLLGVISQHDLIDNAYAKWGEMLREHADELTELVSLLESKASNLARIVETDSLTGCPNRNKFDAALAQEINRYNRYEGAPFSAAFLDIDHFKSINDNYGHLSGDEVLKQFVQLVQKGVRDVDLLARWGGEEFVLLMPNTPVDSASQQVERLRAQVESAQFPEVGQITVSIGVAAYRKYELPEHFVHRVDKALYRAKLGGRNRVEVAE